MSTQVLPLKIMRVECFKDVDIHSINCFIYHSSSDDEFTILKGLMSLKGKVRKVIYINNDINPLYYSIFEGLGGDVYDDMEHLYDDDSIGFLIDSYKETGMAVTTPKADVSKLENYLNILSNASDSELQGLLKNDMWLKSLNLAVKNIDNALVRTDNVNTGVVSMLANATELISSLEEKYNYISEEVEQFKLTVREMEKKTKPATPFVYPTVTVPVTVPSVLYVQSKSHCYFLNTFMLMYIHYLKMTQKKNVKFLLVIPKLIRLMEKYSDGFISLTNDSISVVNVKNSVEFVTSEPSKAVMDTFFNQQGVDLFIVIDLLYGEAPLVRGHMVHTYYACSTPNDMLRLDLSPERVITGIFGCKEGIVIKPITGFLNASAPVKQQQYLQIMGDMYKRLDSIVFKKG